MNITRFRGIGMNPRLFALVTLSTTLISSTFNPTVTALETPYKTSSNEIVVTGLNPRQSYLVQTTNIQGKEDTINVSSNECGYAIISNGLVYQRITINNQTIRPDTLSTRTYPSCNPRYNPTGNNRQTPTN